MMGGMTAATRPPATITEGVVRRLEHLALAVLEPGAELPSESDLAEEYGVSRLTVREAIKGATGARPRGDPSGAAADRGVPERAPDR